MKRAVEVTIPPLSLDRGRPLGPQVCEGLRAAIQTGRLEPNDRVPATRALARALGISRQVIVSAYEDLASAGYLHARVGDGSYVSPAASRWPPPVRTVIDPDAHTIVVWPLR